LAGGKIHTYCALGYVQNIFVPLADCSIDRELRYRAAITPRDAGYIAIHEKDFSGVTFLEATETVAEQFTPSPAISRRMRLPEVAATVEEVRYQARKTSRSHVIATNLRSALLDYQIPSDEALQQAFEPRRERGGLNGGRAESRLSTNLQRHRNPTATRLQW
jgi:hypothetical protein